MTQLLKPCCLTAIRAWVWSPVPVFHQGSLDAWLFSSSNFGWENHAEVIVYVANKLVSECKWSEYRFTLPKCKTQVGNLPEWYTHTHWEEVAITCQCCSEPPAPMWVCPSLVNSQSSSSTVTGWHPGGCHARWRSAGLKKQHWKALSSHLQQHIVHLTIQNISTLAHMGCQYRWAIYEGLHVWFVMH